MEQAFVEDRNGSGMLYAWWIHYRLGKQVCRSRTWATSASAVREKLLAKRPTAIIDRVEPAGSLLEDR